MFDTILGLPLHPLVIHGVVVLLPLMAVLSSVVALRPQWPDRVAWMVAAADAGVFAMTLVAKQSGETLQRSLGGQVALEHGAMGSLMPWFALALVATSVGVALTRRGGVRGRLVPALVVLSGVAATYWTVRTGHAGSAAVWGR